MARAMRTVSLAKRLILFLAKMKFAGKSQILRFIYQKLDIHASGGFYSWLFAPEHGGNCRT